VHAVGELEDRGDRSFQRDIFAMLAIDERYGDRNNPCGSVGSAKKECGAGPNRSGER